MNTFLVILLVAAIIATVVALVRGIISFLRTSTDEVKGQTGPNASMTKSNKMMQQRVLFQAIAILIVVVILFAAGRT